MITHDDVRTLSNQLLTYSDLLEKYIKQQEKKDELLELYREKDLCLSRNCLEKYFYLIKKLEEELKQC